CARLRGYYGSRGYYFDYW
nr:immunoglobulin heavy chain junction region [Mus musculus]